MLRLLALLNLWRQKRLSHDVATHPPACLTTCLPACLPRCRLDGIPFRHHAGDDELGSLAQYYALPWLGMRRLMWDYLPETSEQRRGACPASWDLFALQGQGHSLHQRCVCRKQLLPASSLAKHAHSNCCSLLFAQRCYCCRRCREGPPAALGCLDLAGGQQPPKRPGPQASWQAASCRPCWACGGTMWGGAMPSDELRAAAPNIWQLLLLLPATAPSCPLPRISPCRWMADLIIHWFQQVLHDVATRPLDAEDEEEAQAALGIPMFKVRHCW